MIQTVTGVMSHALANMNALYIDGCHPSLKSLSINGFAPVAVPGDKLGMALYDIFTDDISSIIYLSSEQLHLLGRLICPDKEIEVNAPNGDICIRKASKMAFLEAFTNAVKYCMDAIYVSNHMRGPLITVSNNTGDSKKYHSSGFGTSEFSGMIIPPDRYMEDCGMMYTCHVVNVKTMDEFTDFLTGL